MTSLSRLTATALVALLGVVAAAGITYAASRLVSQPIGLSAEPQRIGDALGPPANEALRRSRSAGSAVGTTGPPAAARTAPARRGTSTRPAPRSTATAPSRSTTDDDSHGRRDDDGDHDADD